MTLTKQIFARAWRDLYSAVCFAILSKLLFDTWKQLNGSRF